MALFDPIKIAKSNFINLVCLFRLSVQVQTETHLLRKGGYSKALNLESDSVRWVLGNWFFTELNILLSGVEYVVHG